MKISDIVRRSGRSLKSAKARTFLTAMAIAIGGFTLTLTRAANNGAKSYVDKILQENFDPTELFVYKDKAIFNEDDKTKPTEYGQDGVFGNIAGNGGNQATVKFLNESDIEKIEKIDGVKRVTPTIFDLLPEYVTRKGQKKYSSATFQQFGSRQNLKVLAGKQTGQPGKRQVLLPETFVKALGFENNQDAVGKEIIIAVRKAAANPTSAQLSEIENKTVGELRSQAYQNSEIVETKFTVIGVRKNITTQQPGTEFAIYAHYQDLQYLHDLVNEDTKLYRAYATATVSVEDGDDEKVLEAMQTTLKKAGFESKSAKDLQELIFSFINALQAIVIVFSIITLIASVFGIINTMYISVLERTREIGLMKALGMSKMSVYSLFTVEAIWIGFIGGVLGALMGLLIGKALNPVIDSQLDLGVDLLQFKLGELGLMILALMVVAFVSAILPARKAAKLDPIVALRTE